MDPNQPPVPQQPSSPDPQPVVQPQPAQPATQPQVPVPPVAPAQPVVPQPPAEPAPAPAAVPAPAQAPAPDPVPTPAPAPDPLANWHTGPQVPQQGAPIPQPASPGAPMPQPAMSAPTSLAPMPSKGKNKLLVFGIPAAIIALVIVGFMVFGGSGGGGLLNQIAGVSLENYSDSTLGVSMQVPKGWTKEERSDDYSKDVTFTEPIADLKDKSEAAKHEARLSIQKLLHPSAYSEVSEQDFFDTIKKGLQHLSEKSSNSSTDTADSYAEELGNVASDTMTTVGGYKAYKVKINVQNFGNTKGSKGYGYGLFVYIDKKTQYEITIDAHESEPINAKADAILSSFTKK